MTSRHLYASVLSALTFLVLYSILLSLTQVEKLLKPAPSSVIKVAIVSPPKEIVPPKIITPLTVIQAKPEPVIKPKPKKIIKKKIVKKVVKKKIIKKKIVKKKIIKKKVIKKPVQTRPIETKPIKNHSPVTPPVYIAPKAIAKPLPKATVTPKNNVKNDHHKKAFLRNVRSKILANKKYPKIAKRRHIEGSVKVRFDITKYGQVDNIRFINGKSVFHKSIRKTLERTFPMGIPNEVKSELPILDVSIVLHFNIR